MIKDRPIALSVSRQKAGTRSPPVGRRARRLKRRQEILNGATRLFLDQGYEAATTNLLVERVGGSKSTIYGHFENKEKLFGAVVDNVLAQLRDSTDAFDLPDKSLVDGLYTVGFKLLKIILSSDHIALARLVIAESKRCPHVGNIYYEHGPSLALKSVEAFLIRRNAFPDSDSDQIHDAAEWFASRLVHRALFRALCASMPNPTPAEMENEVRNISEEFITRFAASNGDVKS